MGDTKMEEIMAYALKDNLKKPRDTNDAALFDNLYNDNISSKLYDVKDNESFIRALQIINASDQLSYLTVDSSGKFIEHPKINNTTSINDVKGEIEKLNKNDPDKVPVLVKLADYIFKFAAAAQQYVIIDDDQKNQDSSTTLFRIYFITQFIHNCLAFDQLPFIRGFYLKQLYLVLYHANKGVALAQKMKFFFEAILLVCDTALHLFQRQSKYAIDLFLMPEKSFASKEQLAKYKQNFDETKSANIEMPKLLDLSYQMVKDFKQALTDDSVNVNRVLFPMTIGFLTSERVPAQIAESFDIRTVYIVSPFIKVCAGLPPGLRALCHAAQTIKPFYYNLSDESSRVRTELIASILRLGGEMVNIKLTGFEIQVTDRDLRPSGAGDWHKLPDVKLFENNPYTWAKLTTS